MTRRQIVAAAFAVSLTLAAGAQAAQESTIDLQAFKGKVVYVDFWASWCGPCRESFPWMQEVHQRYRDKGLVIVGVNVDQDHRLAEDFLNVFRPQFKVVFDQKAQLAEDFHVKGMPASFFIDRSGKVRYQHIGFRSNERSDYERKLEILLAEK